MFYFYRNILHKTSTVHSIANTIILDYRRNANALYFLGNKQKHFKIGDRIELDNIEIPQSLAGRQALLERLGRFYDDMALDTLASIDGLKLLVNPFQESKAMTLDHAAQKEGLTTDSKTAFLDNENHDLAAKLTQIAVDYGYGSMFEGEGKMPPGPYADYESYPGHPNIIGFNGWGFIEELNHIEVDDLAENIGDFMLGGKYGDLLGEFGGMGGFGAGFGALTSMGGLGGGMGGFGGMSGFGGLENHLESKNNALKKKQENLLDADKYDVSEFQNSTLDDILSQWGPGLRAPSFDKYAEQALNKLLWSGIASSQQNLGTQQGVSPTQSGQTPRPSQSDDYLNSFTQGFDLNQLINENDTDENGFKVIEVTMSDLFEYLNISDMASFYDPFAKLLLSYQDLFSGGGLSMSLDMQGKGGGGNSGGGGGGGRNSNSKRVLGVDLINFLNEFSFRGLVELYDYVKGIVEEFNNVLYDLDLTPYIMFLEEIRALLRDANSGNSSYGDDFPPSTKFNQGLDAIAPEAITDISSFLADLPTGIGDTVNDIANNKIQSLINGFVENKAQDKQQRPSNYLPDDDFPIPPHFLEPLRKTPSVKVEINERNKIKYFDFNTSTLRGIKLTRKVFNTSTVIKYFSLVRQVLVDPIKFRNVLVIPLHRQINRLINPITIEFVYVIKNKLKKDLTINRRKINLAYSGRIVNTLGANKITSLIRINRTIHHLSISSNAIIKKCTYIDDIAFFRIRNISVLGKSKTINQIIVWKNQLGLQAVSATKLNINLTSLTIARSKKTLNIAIQNLFSEFTINPLLYLKTDILSRAYSIPITYVIKATISSSSLAFIDVHIIKIVIYLSSQQHKSPDRSMTTALYPHKIYPNSNLYLNNNTVILSETNPISSIIYSEQIILHLNHSWLI